MTKEVLTIKVLSKMAKTVTVTGADLKSTRPDVVVIPAITLPVATLGILPSSTRVLFPSNCLYLRQILNDKCKYVHVIIDHLMKTLKTIFC